MFFRLEILQNFGKKVMITKIVGHFLSFKGLKRGTHIQNEKWNNLCLSPPLPGHSNSNCASKRQIHTHTQILKKYEIFLISAWQPVIFGVQLSFKRDHCWKGNKETSFLL